MRLGSFTASIVVDGKELDEYDVVFESPTKATCWVASEEGKTFGVRWRCHEEQRVGAAQGRVSVDGISCACSLVTAGVFGVNDTGFIGQHISGRTRRDLMFARIQLSDDDSLLKKEIPKGLGDVIVTIERGRVDYVPFHANESRIALDSTEKLHERSKKATVHRVGFGPEQAYQPPRTAWILRRNNEPTIVFVFKYRPLSILQADGIAPRPTSTLTCAAASGSEDEHDVGTPDTDEDIKPTHLNDRIQNLENELKRLRALQADDTEDRKPKRIKIEEPRERKRPLFTTGEIIDLT